MKFRLVVPVIVLGGSIVVAIPASADPFFFSTGDPDGQLASASRPNSRGDCRLNPETISFSGQTITSATFTGLIPHGELEYGEPGDRRSLSRVSEGLDVPAIRRKFPPEPTLRRTWLSPRDRRRNRR